MGQGMRVTVDAAMRARDVSRTRPEDGAPHPPDDGTAEPAQQPATPQKRARRGEKRRLAKRRAANA